MKIFKLLKEYYKQAEDIYRDPLTNNNDKESFENRFEDLNSVLNLLEDFDYKVIFHYFVISKQEAEEMCSIKSDNPGKYLLDIIEFIENKMES